VSRDHSTESTDIDQSVPREDRLGVRHSGAARSESTGSAPMRQRVEDSSGGRLGPAGWPARTWGLILDALASPPAAAVFFMVVLFLWDLVGLTNVSYFGHTNQKATDIAIKYLGGALIAEQVRLLAIQVAVALLLGLVAWALLAARDLVRCGPMEPKRDASVATVGATAAGGHVGCTFERRPSSRFVRFLRALGVVALLHGYVLARALVWMPALYAGAWYSRGGWRASLQAFLTDRLGLIGLDIVAFLVVSVLVFGPLLHRTVRRRWLVARAGMRSRSGLLGRLRGALAGISSGGWSVWAWLTAPILVLAGLLALAGWMTAPSSGHGNKGPNILILASDGVRVDRMVDRGKTLAPHVWKLSQRSAVFTRAYTSLARTFPSWVTLLTGRFPERHGIRHMFPTTAQLARVGLALPGHLAAHGYRTEVMADYAGEIFSRVDLGFQRVSAPAFDFSKIVEQTGLRVHTNLLPYVTGGLGRRFVPMVNGFPDASDPFILARRVRRALVRLQHRDRFFLTVFFSVTHFPYAAPNPYYRRYAVPGYRGPFKYGKTRMFGEGKPSGKDIRQVRGLYDGTVSAMDDAMAQVFVTLKRLGLAKNTIVVITADHGENLYEPGVGMGHGDHLRDEASLRIPLIIHVPGVAGQRVDTVVRDVDLAPTLAALVGHPMPSVDGHDLRPLIEGKRRDLGLTAYSETGLWFTMAGEGWKADDRMPYPEVLGGLMEVDPKHGFSIRVKKRYADLVIAAKHRCIVSGRWKLIYQPLPDGVHLHLYDAIRDPLSQHDLATQHPKMVARLWQKLRSWMLQDPHARQVGDYVLPAAWNAGAPGRSGTSHSRVSASAARR